MDSSLVMNQLSNAVPLVKEVVVDEQQLLQNHHQLQHQYYMPQAQPYAIPVVPVQLVVPQPLVI
jgi:hypothetical protein